MPRMEAGATVSSSAARLDRYFEVSGRGSTIATEVRAGAATFLTMAYILFVNPQILGSVAAPGGVKLPFDQVLTVTALVAGLATLAMGVFGRYPFALAAGLGINAFVAFSLVGADRSELAGRDGRRRRRGPDHHPARARRLPRGGDQRDPTRPQTRDRHRHRPLHHDHRARRRGHRHQGHRHGRGPSAPKLNTWPIAIFVFGLFGTYALVARRVPGALLFGILGTTLLATIVNEIKDKKVFPNGTATWPSKIVATPDFGLVGNFSLHFFSALGFWSAVAIVIAVLLSDFFDTAGTVLGLGRRAGLVTQDGRLPGMRRVLIVDSLAAAGGGAASASSNTTFIESSAGIGEGARTGLASIVTGALFLCCLFISPLAGIIPSAATAPILVIVGAMMFELVRHLEWTEPGIALPVLLTIVLMPMTYSITNGVGAGFISYSVIALLSGRRVHPLLLVFSAMFVWYFVHGVVG